MSSDKRSCDRCDAPRHQTNCLVCGQPLEYVSDSRVLQCHYCGKPFSANATCTSGHFVCDTCHASDALEIVRAGCLQSDDTDPFTLFDRIRSHNSFSVHGPEHHGLVPGVLVATYRNLHGGVSDGVISAAIDRGSAVAGGSCGYMGSCGAAQGVGAAFAAILGSTPLAPELRRISMSVTAQVLTALASFDAARCCYRDSLLAIDKAIELSSSYLPHPWERFSHPTCRQLHKNKECIQKNCPWWPANSR